MNLWHDIEARKGENLNTIIEVPKFSRVKYELDKDTGLIKVDRVLYSPMHYPADYGFVPKTLWDDGDPLDVLVLSLEGYVPGCLVEVRVVGALEMTDDGDDDLKILGVPEKDPRTEGIRSLEDLEAHTPKEIKHFFQVYKDLQDKKVDVGEWLGVEEAQKAVEKSLEQYSEKFGK